MTWQTRVIHWLAVHRLTQLWTSDRITRRIRVDIARAIYGRSKLTADGEPLVDEDDATVDDFARDDPDPPLKVWLVYCWWCAGWWIALAWSIATRARWVREHLSPVLACSSVVVLIKNVIAVLANDAE